MHEDNSILDDKVKAALGTPPQADFEAWKARHAEALHHLNPVVTAMHDQRRRVLARVAKFAIAASVALVAISWLLVSQERSFAQTIETIKKAESISWSISWYDRMHSVDKRRTWLNEHPKWERSYMAPTHWRDVKYDKDGNVASVSIEDTAVGKVLRLNMKNKTAMLVSEPSGQFGSGPPFGNVTKILQNEPVEFVGEKVVDGITVNTFRNQHKYEHGQIQNNEIWIDKTSKALVGHCSSREGYFDLATDPDRDNPAEEKFSTGTIAGVIDHHINFNAQLDPSLFSLTPPEGFTLVQSPQRPKVTEDTMIENLRLSAQANAGEFIELEKDLSNIVWHNSIATKDKASLNEAEKKYLEFYRKLMLQDNRAIVQNFCIDSAEPKTFRYLGKGVKLGDANRIVCFYRLKETGKYRAVYGDLHVSDIDPKELPLPVE